MLARTRAKLYAWRHSRAVLRPKVGGHAQQDKRHAPELFSPLRKQGQFQLGPWGIGVLPQTKEWALELGHWYLCQHS